MNNLINLIAVFVFSFGFIGCNQAQKKTVQKTTQVTDNQPSATEAERGYFLTSAGDTVHKVIKSDTEWEAELNTEEYDILRHEGTERSFTGDLWDHKESGVYVCRGCQFPLFSSRTKFKSGTGWPSYYEPVNDYCIQENVDNKHGWKRVEVECKRCGGHLGHVFEDGPKPTGLRYCINSASLDFIKEEN